MSSVDPAQWNHTEADYPRGCTIADLFRTQAARTPDAIAVVSGDRRLTYRELDELSERRAQHLRTLGVQAEVLVGVAIERSEELLVSLLGILKSGGAYVPLDLNHPPARLTMVIEDSGASIILTTPRMRGRLPIADGRVVVLDSRAPKGAARAGTDAGPENLAYVIYTSGSTGKPKGVMIEHRNVVNFFTGMDRAIGCGGGTWLAVTSISFDISVLELLWTLTRGFQVVVHDEEGKPTIGEEITRYGVTHLQMTPSLARMLTLEPRSSAALGSLKQLLLGGEALPSSLITRLRSSYDGEIFNMYGPTETTIWSTTFRVEAAAGSIPIGKPIANTQTYLLDDDLRPVPIGQAGELFIGGDGVVRGYWKRPELTAQRFLPDPFRAGGRVYRTGDLARYLPDGNIEFIGRADFQIKLRGFRIELGEIEAALEQQPGVRQAVVVAREDKADDKRLVAYLTRSEDGQAPVETLRKALASKLPEYMIPSSFVYLNELPLTGNLKIDRKALLELPPPVPTVSAAAQPLASDLERTIAEAWKEALNVASVGPNDNFFDLGAHSLIVAEVHVRLQEVLHRELSLLDLFQFPTVQSLATHLGGVSGPAALSDRAQRRLAARGRARTS